MVGYTYPLPPPRGYTQPIQTILPGPIRFARALPSAPLLWSQVDPGYGPETIPTLPLLCKGLSCVHDPLCPVSARFCTRLARPGPRTPNPAEPRYLLIGSADLPTGLLLASIMRCLSMSEHFLQFNPTAPSSPVHMYPTESHITHGLLQVIQCSLNTPYVSNSH
jgi:hypothetical protein